MEDDLNYQRIAKAIDFLRINFKKQPSLDEIAKHVNLSPYHFQKLFTDWAGVSPKKFIQYLSVNYAKSLLNQSQTSLFDTALEVGLSGTSRLYDLFVNIEGMTPGEYKNGGKDLVINYDFIYSPFGELLVASTQKGVCYLSFIDESEATALDHLKNNFFNADFIHQSDLHQKKITDFFNGDFDTSKPLQLHLKGTEFQLKVWEALLTIPFANLTSYGELAKKIKSPNASRAVGTAIGNNPVAYIIPCHRVIQGNGTLGGYMWGLNRKSSIIAWEASKQNKLI